MISPSITVAIPSRGRPDLLRESLRISLATARGANTVFVVGLDDDDITATDTSFGMMPPKQADRVMVSIAPREDSLGAKYNRINAVRPAAIHVTGSDDMAFQTPGWDLEIAKAASVFPDRIGFISGELMGGAVPMTQAFTRPLLDALGGYTEWFPYWFLDMWVDEIVLMIERRIFTPVKAVPIRGRGKTQGLIDLVFWQGFFEFTRDLREETAASIIQSDAYDAPRWRKQQMLANFPLYRHQFEHRSNWLMVPEAAAEVEATMSCEAPRDERYQRIKQRAVDFVKACGRTPETAAA